MADYDDDNDTNNGGNSGGGGLRKQLEDALRQNTEMKTQLGALQQKETTRAVQSALSEKGLNPKLARFVPAEEGSDPARLETWIKENADLFAPNQGGEGDNDTGDGGGKPSIPEGSADAFNKISKVSESGSHSVVDLAALNAQLANVKTEQEFNQLVSQYRIN